MFAVKLHLTPIFKLPISSKNLYNIIHYYLITAEGICFGKLGTTSPPDRRVKRHPHLRSFTHPTDIAKILVPANVQFNGLHISRHRNLSMRHSLSSALAFG